MENLNRYQTEEDKYSRSPEQRLWKAVLAQAVYDALFEKQNVKKCERRDARDWFLFKTESFYETCRNAGFDPNYVYEKMKKKILNQSMIWKMQKHGQRKSAILGVKIHD